MSHPAASAKLLVSVRNLDEAKSTLVGGADIIDVKDPDRGSLGRADPSVISELASLPECRDRRIPLSVALGEVDDSGKADLSPLPANITFAKLGLAGLRATPDWISRWHSVRQRYEHRSDSRIRWIAVIYADETESMSPTAGEIIAAAAQTGCVGVLVDTFDKTAGGLLELVSLGDLSDWAGLARRHGLLIAVAGRLSLDDLPLVASVSPDVIAVRSAVCERNDRRAGICADRVADFKRALQNLTAGTGAPVSTG